MDQEISSAIGYIRVSTQKQKDSGLSLEAQRYIIEETAKSRNIEIVAWYEEQETATNKRIRLIQRSALQFCKENKCMFITARLDRFARDFDFFRSLLRSGQPYLFCDCPDQSDISLNVQMIFAEQQAKSISENTKKALGALKKRGVTLGKPENFNNDGRKAGGETVRLQALSHERNLAAYALIKSMTRAKQTKKDMVIELNHHKMKTPEGKNHTLDRVYRLIKMYDGVDIDSVKFNKAMGVDELCNVA